ncbi:hypothetical protein CCH79_00015944 [Gambusia affinis]|uniref:Uncharacterized protein n=1 Tax=Gambusia affinis TaxID=33528 RepID=A0A315VYN6_GAMAF|nr:hypothetical protein CCH79_00015944 [Gambusia affinis]
MSLTRGVIPRPRRRYRNKKSGFDQNRQLHLPLTTPLPGSELTKEPFRWDQRLFALVLRIPGNASVEPEPLGGVPPDDSPITPMCEVTGVREITGLPLNTISLNMQLLCLQLCPRGEDINSAQTLYVFSTSSSNRRGSSRAVRKCFVELVMKTRKAPPPPQLLARMAAALKKIFTLYRGGLVPPAGGRSMLAAVLR